MRLASAGSGLYSMRSASAVRTSREHVATALISAQVSESQSSTGVFRSALRVKLTTWPKGPISTVSSPSPSPSMNLAFEP